MIFAGLWVMISPIVREKRLRNNQDQHQSLAPSKTGSLLLLLIIPWRDLTMLAQLPQGLKLGILTL